VKLLAILSAVLVVKTNRPWQVLKLPKKTFKEGKWCLKYLFQRSRLLKIEIFIIRP